MTPSNPPVVAARPERAPQPLVSRAKVYRPGPPVLAAHDLGALRPAAPNQTLDLPAMLGDPTHFQPVYAQANVYIFAVK